MFTLSRVVHQWLNEYLLEQHGFDAVVQVVHLAGVVLADALLTIHLKVIANASKPRITIGQKGKLL